MFQRYALPDQLAAEREFMPTEAWWKFSRRFNVSGRQYVPCIRLHEGRSEGVMMRWGFIPSWVEGEPSNDAPLTSRPEDLEASTLFRGSWQSSQRCILPVAGFYTWHLTRSRYRQPYYVRLLDRSVFGVAGIWDRWVGDDDDVIESCCVVCMPANALICQVANSERQMPAILRRKDYANWLQGSATEVRGALQTYACDAMEAYAVSPRVNATGVEGIGLTKPVERLTV